MPISLLRINDFRNLAVVECNPILQGLNVISGINGSGKTSILEAMHVLSVGKSFRTNTVSQLIRHKSNKLSIFGHIITENAAQSTQSIPVGIERDLEANLQIRIAHQNIFNLSELAALLPLRIINSQSHLLLEAGPQYRRKFLDWGLFYQSDNFLMIWRQFQRALKQRNILLKKKCTTQELNAWTQELVKYGSELDQLRKQYISQFKPFLLESIYQLLPLDQLEINYLCGWSEYLDYQTAVKLAHQEELLLGYTIYGPHKADIELSSFGVPLKHFLSRGQQKLLICAMILAQGKLLTKHLNKRIIYLVDDLPAELDNENKRKLISLLSTLQTQVFITAIEHKTICDLITASIPIKLFHVEQGNLKESTSRRENEHEHS